MTDILINKITQSLPLDFEILKKESLQEGFNFLARLEREWHSGVNNFSKPGEGLYQATYQGELIAVAGISIIMRLISIAYCVVYASAGAVGPVFGQNFGANQFPKGIEDITYISFPG